jgi:hypothetical protein
VQLWILDGEGEYLIFERERAMAATFTRIEEGEQPSIVVHPSHKVAKVNDNIYGGFTE